MAPLVAIEEVTSIDVGLSADFRAFGSEAD